MQISDKNGKCHDINRMIQKRYICEQQQRHLSLLQMEKNKEKKKKHQTIASSSDFVSVSLFVLFTCSPHSFHFSISFKHVVYV